MTTLAELKAGAVLPPPVYRSKPYVLTVDCARFPNQKDMVLSSGTLRHFLSLSDYYDDCIVSVREHDLYMNDNSKLPVARPAPRGLSAGELIAKLKKLPASAHVILSSDEEGNDFGLCVRFEVQDDCVFLYPASGTVEVI